MASSNINPPRETSWPGRVALVLGGLLWLWIGAGGFLALWLTWPVAPVDDRLLGPAQDALAFVLLGGCAAFAASTSPWWTRPVEQRPPSAPALLRALAVSTTAVAYGHLAVGITLRYVPLGVSPDCFSLVTYGHLTLAAFLTGHVVLLVVWGLRRSAVQSRLRRPSAVLLLLVVAQLLLGAATWVTNFYWPRWLQWFELATRFTSIEARGLWQSLAVSTHTATGALIAAVALWIAFRARR